MTSNVIPFPKDEPKPRQEYCMFILKRKDGWVDYNLGEVFFLGDEAFGYSEDFPLLHMDAIRARQIDDPEVIRDVVRQKLKLQKRQIEAALIAIEKPIVTINEEDNVSEDDKGKS